MSKFYNIMLRYIKWINLCAFVIMLAVNILANLIPLGGNTTGEISARYKTLFTPAGFTFSIWGLIYLLLAVSIILIFFPGKDVLRMEIIDKCINPFFAISCLMNILWILSWHFRLIEPSMIFIVGLWVTLYTIMQNLTDVKPNSAREYIVIITFEIYFGWIYAASLVNLNVLFTKLGVISMESYGQVFTILSILAATLFGALFILNDHRFFSGLAVIWADIGILGRHVSKTGFNFSYKAIIAILVFSILVNLIVIIIYLPICDGKQNHQMLD